MQQYTDDCSPQRQATLIVETNDLARQRWSTVAAAENGVG
jgi:hypothetical protein